MCYNEVQFLKDLSEVSKIIICQIQIKSISLNY